jgi:hypothetical protein
MDKLREAAAALETVRGQLMAMAEREEGPTALKLEQMGLTLGDAVAALGGWARPGPDGPSAP